MRKSQIERQKKYLARVVAENRLASLSMGKLLLNYEFTEEFCTDDTRKISSAICDELRRRDPDAFKRWQDVFATREYFDFPERQSPRHWFAISAPNPPAKRIIVHKGDMKREMTPRELRTMVNDIAQDNIGYWLLHRRGEAEIDKYEEQFFRYRRALFEYIKTMDSPCDISIDTMTDMPIVPGFDWNLIVK